MLTHRQTAKRKTVLWQAGAIVVLAAAGAAIALPAVSEFFAPPKPPTPTPPVVVAPPARPDYSSLPYNDAIQGTLSVSYVLPPKPPENPGPPDEPITSVVSIPPPSTDWAYIGSIITPSNRHALIKVNEQQQIYSIGSTHDDTKLVVIEKDHIEVEIAGVRKSIQLAERKLLTPTEGPKRPVAFRNQPNGQPGAGMVMNTLSRPNPAASAAAGTLDQARANAMAAAEAARRAEAAAHSPSIIPFDKLDGEDVQIAAKNLNDPNLDEGARMKFLSQLGIGPGTPIDQALGRAKEAGIDLGGDAGKGIMNALEQNAKNQGNR